MDIYILTFYLTYFLGLSGIHSGILCGIYSTKIWRSRLTSSAHCDLPLTVEVWQCPHVPTEIRLSQLRSGSAGEGEQGENKSEKI
jgi:hypothetical protein